MLGFASSTLYCPLFLNLAKIGHQVSNAQSFSVCTGAPKEPGHMPQKWSGCEYLQASLKGLCVHNFLEKFELGLYWNFCVTSIRGGRILRVCAYQGMVLYQGFLLRIYGYSFLGASISNRDYEPCGFFPFPTEIRNFTLFLLMVCLIFKELEWFRQMLLC